MRSTMLRVEMKASLTTGRPKETSGSIRMGFASVPSETRKGYRRTGSRRFHSMRLEKERVAGSFLVSFKTGANWLSPRAVG